MSGVALGVAAVAVGTSVAASESAKSGAKKAAKAKLEGNQKAGQALFDALNKSNAALQSGFNANLPVQQGVLNSSLGYQQPYSSAGQAALASLMEQIAPRPAQAASGTLPEEAARIKSAYYAAIDKLQQAQKKLDDIAAQGQGLQFSGANAPLIGQLQQQGNAATVELQQAQQEANQAQQALQNMAPYQPAQDAVSSKDATFSRQFTAEDYANDPTTGSVPGTYAPTYANDFSQGNEAITAKQINDFLAANPGIDDRTILDAMQKYGVSGQQMSNATGAQLSDVSQRIKDANLTYTPGTPSTPPDLTKNFTMADYQADPGYQFRLDQGNKAINNSAAARGGLLSGATMKAIADYNSGAASQEYGAAFNRFGSNRENASRVYNDVYSRWNDQNNTIFNRLSALAGSGQTASTNQGGYQQNYGTRAQQDQQFLTGGLADNYSNYGKNYAGLMSDNGQIIGDRQTQIANANGAMIQGIGNAVSSGISSYAGGQMAGGVGGAGGTPTGNLNRQIDQGFYNYNWNK